MRPLLETTAPAPDADDVFAYWDYKDLAARKIVGSRTDLHRKQRFFGFPKPVILTGGKGAAALYKIADVKAWLLAREALAMKNTEPELTPSSPPRGRPKKIAANSARLPVTA